MKAGVREALGLPRNGVHHLRMPVARVEHRDAGGKIDVAATVDVPELGVLGAGDVNAPGGHPICDRCRFAGLQFLGGRHKMLRCSEYRARTVSLPLILSKTGCKYDRCIAAV